MARSRSVSRDRARDRARDNDRKRDRSHSPREKDSRKRSKATPVRDPSHRRSRSPTRDRRRDRDARTKSRSPARKRDREAGERSRSPARRRDRDGRASRSPVKDRRRDRDAGERSRSPQKRDGSERPRAKENGKDREEPSRGKSRDRSRDRDRDRDRGRDKPRADKEQASSRGRGRDEERQEASREERKEGRESRKERTEYATAKVSEEGELAEAVAASEPAKKAEPLSLEEFLKKKKKEEEEAAKPKFLSKKQREELALQRRQEQADAQKQRTEEVRKEHNPYQSVADREREACKREADRRLEQDRQRYKEERERQKELELIKQQYLGGEKVKKKIRKPSEKFHLNFDWEASDDTSRDLNPIYNSTHEAALLFGSGKRAGVDVQEQKKMAAEHQRQLLKKMREAQGLKETKQDRDRDRERTRIAASFDDFDSKKAVAHWSDKARDEMTERDWRIFREDFNISYKGVNVSGTAMPVRNWAEAGLPAPLMQAIDELGYMKPSPIQMASIPLGLMQRDVIGVAETGSGKTAAFVLPMLCYLMKQPEMTEEVAVDGPYSIVMAPVRELAQQIEEETNKLAKFTKFRTVSVVGGQDINDQAFKLRKGCEIVIATPGRLKDCVEQSYAVLNQCNYVVLDEADRMIDMGFEPQVVGVLDAMPSSNLKPEEEDGIMEENRVYRTTYMFSATMPPTVERLARKYMRRPVVINIGSAGKATENVTQKVYMVKENEKLSLMERELEEVEDSRAIVFANTKRSCDVIAKHLDHLGYRCTMLHGGKAQDQREASLQGFREDKYNVLVATNVAGRGIDVPDVALVVNYDMPNTIGEYTHRIGRTARAGRKGVAITFLTLSDTEVFYDLKRLLEESNAAVPPQLAHHEAAKQKQLPGDKPRREQTIYA